jgi:hypothetical protein
MSTEQSCSSYGTDSQPLDGVLDLWIKTEWRSGDRTRQQMSVDGETGTGGKKRINLVAGVGPTGN